MARKRTDLYVWEKLQILDELKNGKTQMQIVRERGIKQSSLATLKRNEDKIRQQAASSEHPQQRRFKPASPETVESALWKWFRFMRPADAPLSDQALLQQAEQIAQRLGIRNFDSSNNWLQRWKLSHRVDFKDISSERAAIVHETLQSAQPSQAEAVLVQHTREFPPETSALRGACSVKQQPDDCKLGSADWSSAASDDSTHPSPSLLPTTAEAQRALELLHRYLEMHGRGTDDLRRVANAINEVAREQRLQVQCTVAGLRSFQDGVKLDRAAAPLVGSSWGSSPPNPAPVSAVKEEHTGCDWSAGHRHIEGPYLLEDVDSDSHLALPDPGPNTVETQTEDCEQHSAPQDPHTESDKQAEEQMKSQPGDKWLAIEYEKLQLKRAKLELLREQVDLGRSQSQTLKDILTALK
ncbi:hypothetical protein AOXY_G29069 [Acipenser oxyrinchus oxyrinchus]|uniref:HTH CENPB-type domain-containing protein n=1 Tax=Acipenser oxyrinchus oxyrinchus TaxID=40147 RepID=A0AAD8CRH3_ACIOX|nr:hypothetical protein AOXY_G29069 [Acipenser oxyrinchus oxyrinchus]